MNTFHRIHGRRILGAASAAVLLAAGGCRSTAPCSPPACMAEREPAPRCCQPPPCAPAPAPSPCAPPPCYVAQTPRADSDEAVRMKTLQTTIDRQREQLELQRQAMARLDAAEKAKGMALEEAKTTRLSGDQAAQQLADELKGMPGAQVLVEGNKVVVIVTDCFESGSEKLKPNPDVRAALRSTSAAILRHPEAQVSVVGHTDSKPIQKKLDKWPTNVELSKARAETVATALSSDGVTRERLATDGRGSAEMLIVPEKTAADRARNRRVEVQFGF